ncbi:MAG: hypothetical protein JWO52_6977, partial [Gammaproteobacteria bacterium]|nr:hypothetical protein [Gammaproteobacteria bacterium]
MVAGIGCRSGVSAEEVELALVAALVAVSAPIPPARRTLSLIATP